MHNNTTVQRTKLVLKQLRRKLMLQSPLILGGSGGLREVSPRDMSVLGAGHSLKRGGRLRLSGQTEGSGGLNGD